MANNKAKTEEVFGQVSDFHGAFGGTGVQRQKEVRGCTTERTPHWHDSCFDGTGVKQEKVTEEDLCIHF